MSWSASPLASVSAGILFPNSSITTPPIDTTGADFFSVNTAWYNNNGLTMAVTDSKGNAWNALTPYVVASGGGVLSSGQIWWSRPTSAGTGHTFTFSGTSTIPCINVMAWSGSAISPLDQEAGNAPTSFPNTSLQPGNITPGQSGCLVVCGLTVGAEGTGLAIDSGFTVGASLSTAPSQFGTQFAYLIQGSASAVNPLWSATAADLRVSAIASFKAAATGPTSIFRNANLSGLQGGGPFFVNPLGGKSARQPESYVRRNHIYVPQHVAAGREVHL